jgi:hypothetical protein
MLERTNPTRECWVDARLLLLQLILRRGGTGSTRLLPALSLRYGSNSEYDVRYL